MNESASTCTAASLYKSLRSLHKHDHRSRYIYFMVHTDLEKYETHSIYTCHREGTLRTYLV
jgi:hypothetical protein